MISGVHTVNNLLRERIKLRAKQEWNLNNPHIWADQVIGREIYEKHTRHSGKWLGWTDFQIAFMRDVCDFRFPIVFAICNRGGSKTMLTSYATACLQDNLDNFRVSIVSGSKRQATQAYKYCSDVFSLTDMRLKVDGEITLSKTEIIGGGGVEILTASEKETRSIRADMIIIDEACSAKASILESIFGQVITAEKIKIVFLTTPDKVVHIAKKWWDKAHELGMIRYHWTAYECPWIPKKNIQIFRRLLDKAGFLIEVLAKWTSRAGSIFEHEDIMKSLCDVADLPPMEYIERFCAGIDWGDAHETVITIIGYYGNPIEGNDQWFVYDQESYQKEDLDVILNGGKSRREIDDSDLPVIKRGMVNIIQSYDAYTISEHSAISAYANQQLEDKLAELGFILERQTFARKKPSVIGNSRVRLESGKYKIPRKFEKLVDQLIDYHHKIINGIVTEEVEKVNDDRVDSFLFGNWIWNPKMVGIETIGDLGENSDY